MTTHLYRSRPSQRKSGAGHAPWCGQRSQDGKDWAKSYYTDNFLAVTCKKCRRAINKGEVV